jgi:hypothetical protein
VAERQDARDELGGAEVAVPHAGHVGLAEQVPGAGRGNPFRVEVLLLDGDELVGDGVQVQLGTARRPVGTEVRSSEATAPGSAVMSALRVSVPKSARRLSPAARYSATTSPR